MRSLNPEQLFVASLSACQALTYLFLTAKYGVSVAELEGDLVPNTSHDMTSVQHRLVDARILQFLMDHGRGDRARRVDN